MQNTNSAGCLIASLLIVVALSLTLVTNQGGCGPDPPDPPDPPGPNPGPVVPIEGEATVLILHDAELTSAEKFVEMLELQEAVLDNNDFNCLLLPPDCQGETGTRPEIIAAAQKVPDDKTLPYAFVVTDKGIAKQGEFTNAETVAGWLNLKQRERDTRLPLSEESFSRLVDVDFELEGQLLGFNATYGAYPPESLEFSSVGLSIIPRADWNKWLDAGISERLRRFVRHIKYQREGSCVGNAGVNGFEFRSLILFGNPNDVVLSPMSVYKRIGRSAQSGAYVGDGVDEMLARGALPSNTPENKSVYQHTHGETSNWSVRLPSGWESTGKKFRSVKYVKVTNKEQWFTMLVHGCPVWYGRKRHSISSVYPVKRDGRVYFAYENSWNDTWGDNGIGYDSESLISGLTGYALVEIVARKEVGIPNIR